MKTSIKSLIALAITAVVLTTSSISSFAADEKETNLTEVKKVSTINVSGNVALILVQSNEESVKVYDNYYAKNALVQKKDGELRISSYSKETLTVVVYVANLSSITASDRATVKTIGKMNVLSLAVNLYGNATADINTNAIDLSSNVSDDSNLTLSGSTETYTSLVGNFAKVNMSQFVAQTTNIQSKVNSAFQVSKLSQIID